MTRPCYPPTTITLTGRFRFRPHKLTGAPVLQVEFTGHYHLYWRDATFQEAIDIQFAHGRGQIHE